MSSTTINKTDQPPDTQSYPRTGKRGVPQQFPRRLYTMLESESILNEDAQVDNEFEPVIQWSGSGQAFRILDFDKFSNDVLPKYFRTSKFSSFQRNLNLYGFSKVRKGPDTDFYAHPSFLKGRPELLSLLKKCKHGSTSNKKSKVKPAVFATKVEGSIGKNLNQEKTVDCNVFMRQVGHHVSTKEMIHRIVSPCHSSNSSQASSSSSCSYNTVYNGCNTSFGVTRNISMSSSDSGTSFTDAKTGEKPSSSNQSWTNKNENVRISSSNTGKLGLLALAIECLADRDVVSSA